MNNYKVFYSTGYNEEYQYENFENIEEAIEFAEKQKFDSYIIRYSIIVPISEKATILY